jgi:class 3 adenylate cyclase
MSLNEDLNKEVKSIFATRWVVRDGQVVPEPEDVKLGNDAVKLAGTVLYADLAESTNLVDNHTPQFAAEIYKSYLHCAAKIISNQGGVITAFDGDRVMGVFVGTSKNTSAAKCALKINHAVVKIINPAIKVQYPDSSYTVKHGVGVDKCELFIARTGIRGSNDLVWVGRAANYAAKLCSLRNGVYASYITADIYNNMHESAKLSNNQLMWEKRVWTETNIFVYRSSWTWKP